MSEIDLHARRIAELMEELEAGDGTVEREKVFALLEDVDHLHRTCVWRLFERMTELGGKGLVERLTADPAIRTLFVLYDLIPDQPLMPVEADAPVAPPQGGGFVPLASLQRKPAWRVAFAADDLPRGSLQAVEIDGVPVLLCAGGEEVTAFRNLCPGSALPLHLAPLADGEIRCPWHGCRFEAATGKRIDGRGGDLEPFRVEARDGRIYVALAAPRPAPATAAAEVTADG